MLLFFGQIRPGADPGRGKNKFFQETSSSDRKATATNRMHSNDLEACGKKCCYPRATRCDGDIVTLLWFRACVCVCVRASGHGPCEHDRD